MSYLILSFDGGGIRGAFSARLINGLIDVLLEGPVQGVDEQCRAR